MAKELMKGNVAIAEAAVRAGLMLILVIPSPHKLNYWNTFLPECLN